MSTPEPKHHPDDVREKYCPILSRANGSAQGDWVLCIGDACAAFRERSSLTMDNPSRVPGQGLQTINKIGYCGVGGKP